LTVFATPSLATLRISEFLAENDGSLADQDGDSPDWIEIRNQSAAPVNLAGWHLTDDPSDLTQWTFPSLTVPAEGYALVFASGKNRARAGAELHTNFQLDNAGEFLALVQPDSATIEHAYSPAFPPQRANISFGLGRAVTTTPLVTANASARLWVPTDGAWGDDWTAPAFDDSSWLFATNGIGFDAATVAGPSNALGQVVLSLDFNDDDSGETGAANTESSFGTMTLSANPSTFAGLTVTLSALGGGVLDDRDRNTPAPAPPNFTQDQLYDDFIFVNGTTNGNGLRLRITGLLAHTAYHITLWSFDSGSPGSRLSDWIETASGATNVLAAGYSFDGGLLPPRDGANTLGGYVRASATGELLIEGRRSGGTSHGVFLNALQLVQVSFRSAVRTDVASLMTNRSASAFVRLPFVVSDPSALQVLKLRVRYEDGFVAYLNGQWIASRNAPSAPAWDSVATASRDGSQALVYEEFTVANGPGLLSSGAANVLALHGLNESTVDFDFLILAELEGVQAAEYPARYFLPPTPGQPNGLGYLGLVADTKFSANRGFYDAPVTVAITTATPGADIRWTTNGSVPSLTNGARYIAPLTFSHSTLLRAAAFRADFLPSDVDTHTYLFLDQVLRQPARPSGYPTTWQAGYPADYEMDSNVVNHPTYRATLKADLRAIPTLSLVTDHNALWHSSTGIYVNSVSSGLPWERPTSAELIQPDGATAFQVNCGVRIQGNASRDNVRTPKHSFRLLFKSQYGPSKLSYAWFPGSTVSRFDNLVLRACFTDSWPTRYAPADASNPYGSRYRPEDSLYLRDVWMKDAQRDLGWHSAHSDFVHLYVNGLYWGLYNPCERLDASHFAEHFGGREADWDVLRDFSEVLAGSKADWDRMMAIVNRGITSEAAYQAVVELVDLENLIDYMLLHIFAEAEDWPHHNWYAAHRRATNGLPATRWIFCVWDQEIVLDQLYRRNRVPVDNADTPSHIYAQLRAWPEFRRLFGDRVQKHLFNGGALTASNCIARLQARAAQIDRAIVGESARWGDAREFPISPNAGTGKTFTRDEWWVPELDRLYTNFLPHLATTNVARLRAANLYPALGAPEFNPFGGAISNGFALVIAHTNASGTVFFTRDGTDPRELGSGAVSPSAEAFAEPVELNQPTLIRARVKSGATWSALVEATFYPPQDLSRLALTEIMYHPPALGVTNGDDFEFLELKNTGTLTLNLSGLAFSTGVNFIFTNGSTLAPGEFFVLARHAAAFSAQYPGVKVHGVFTGRLDNGGETLVLSHALGSRVFTITYDDDAPWPVGPDGHGYSLVPRNPGAPAASEDGAKWRASTQRGGSPGADDPVASIPPIVISEVLTASPAPLRDAIELFNPTATRVDVGGWFLTDDPGEPRKFRIPHGATLGACGFLVFDESDFNATPGARGSLSLNAQGDEVYLFSGDAQTNLTGYSHGFSLGAAEPGISFGRYLTSTGEEHFAAQRARSLGGPNTGPIVGPIVLNEIHYHPENPEDEFLELLNVTDVPVPLFDPASATNTWRLSGLDWSFPTNTWLAPRGLLVLAASSPALFSQRHTMPTHVPVLGPYAGVLQDSGERLCLQRAAAPDTNGLAWIDVEAVRYNDKAPWPPAADGGGTSLQRVDPTAYGNDPINWHAESPTPGRLNTGADSDGDGLPDGWESAHGTAVLQPDADLDADLDGLSNRAEYLAGTHPTNALSALRVERLRASAPTISIEFYALSNRIYRVHHTDQLGSPHWTPLIEVSTRPTNRLETVIDAAPRHSQRFYRLSVRPTP
jgi:hypothetical protein